MKPVRVFSHATSEPPGYIVNLLERLQYPIEMVCLDNGSQVPMSLDDISGLIFMGGAGNVNDATDWMLQEMSLIQQAVEQDIAVLGICLGAQLMSKALGGKVWEADQVEVGWHKVKLLPVALDHCWFKTLPEEFTAFQWHAHALSPPPAAVSMATSECTRCQAFTLGNSLAIQFHLEMSEDIIRYLINKFSSDLVGNSSCVQNQEQILLNISDNCQQTFNIADKLLEAWLHSLKH